MGNERKTVLKLLIKLETNSSYSNILLDEGLEKSSLTPQEKKFAAALFYGVIERRITLDACIRAYAAKPDSKLGLEVKNILRMGIYQLCYMNSVPESAAVDESVKLAKNNRNPAAAGFVNGLLRSFIRNEKKLPVGATETEQLVIDYSCPMWLVMKWTKEYGSEMCREMLETSLGQAPETVRINTVYFPLKNSLDMLTDDGVTFERVGIVSDCLKICCQGAIEHTNAFKKGRLHVQDISSQLCCSAVNPQENDVVIDVCSAPGGKTFTMAERMKNKGSVYASDLHLNRVKLIKCGAERLGLSCVSSQVSDAKTFNDKLPKADRVLCDVPCSGLGVIRRKPEIKYKKPIDFERLPQVQYEILNTSADYVKVGGTLVYSTCTLSRAENDEVADRFLKEHEDFVPSELGSDFGEDADKCRITITPQKYNSDGFFIAKFVRLR